MWGLSVPSSSCSSLALRPLIGQQPSSWASWIKAMAGSAHLPSLAKLGLSPKRLWVRQGSQGGWAGSAGGEVLGQAGCHRGLAQYHLAGCSQPSRPDWAAVAELEGGGEVILGRSGLAPPGSGKPHRFLS